MQFVPVTLDTNHVYTFVVHEEPRGDLRITKLLLNGQTIYDIEKCEAHQTRMEPKVVRIASERRCRQGGCRRSFHRQLRCLNVAEGDRTAPAPHQ